jgi:hypothetical protein
MNRNPKEIRMWEYPTKMDTFVELLTRKGVAPEPRSKERFLLTKFRPNPKEKKQKQALFFSILCHPYLFSQPENGALEDETAMAIVDHIAMEISTQFRSSMTKMVSFVETKYIPLERKSADLVLDLLLSDVKTSSTSDTYETKTEIPEKYKFMFAWSCGHLLKKGSNIRVNKIFTENIMRYFDRHETVAGEITRCIEALRKAYLHKISRYRKRHSIFDRCNIDQDTMRKRVCILSEQIGVVK